MWHRVPILTKPEGKGNPLQIGRTVANTQLRAAGLWHPINTPKLGLRQFGSPTILGRVGQKTFPSAFARMIRKTFALGTPISFAIARPVNPRAFNRSTSLRYAATFSGRPSLTPRRRARAKPALILSTATARLNSEIASSVSRTTLPGTLEVSMARLGMIRANFVRDRLSKHPHELRHTASQPLKLAHNIIERCDSRCN
jgi:hypothetical protein